MAGDRLSRRRVLAGLAGFGTAALAGCTSAGSGGTTPTGDGDGPIQSVAFAGEDLVVTLREDHAVKRLNLIDPAGATYRQNPVATGVTTVRLQILAINADVGGYEHYEPGTYELVAVRDGDSVTREIELRPSLEIVDVAQYRDGERTRSLAKLAVTVENTGSGPTWVQDIQYRNAPYYGANQESKELPSIPLFRSPQTPENLIVEPGESQAYVGTDAPFTYTDQKEGCADQVEMTVILGLPTKTFVDQRVTASVRGEMRSIEALSSHTCDEINVELGAGLNE